MSNTDDDSARDDSEVVKVSEWPAVWTADRDEDERQRTYSLVEEADDE